MKRALVIQHVPHERLGTLEAGFAERGLRLQPLHVYQADAAWPALSKINGVISMGGPQSVYEQGKYPYLASELDFLRAALEAGRPVLGVCLGAQLLAAALGAKVSKHPQKEIGWYPVMREPGADGDPLANAFGQTETVFQWHGDSFALPAGAVRLFSSPLCAQQAFRWQDRAYGLQFHVEVTEPIVRAWLQTPINKSELASLRGTIDPLSIRRQARQHIGRLQELSRHVAGVFAGLVQGEPTHARDSKPQTAAQR